MKAEIKEILKYIQKYTDEYETTNLTEIRALQMGYVDTVLLLDYITNLQEERDKFKSRNEKAMKLLKEFYDSVNYDEIIALLEKYEQFKGLKEGK